MQQISDLQIQLVDAIGRHVPEEGDWESPISGLTLFRRDTPSEPCACLVEASIVVVVRGVKQMWIGNDSFRYDVSKFLITSLDLPARSEVLAASEAEPCLGFALKLDLRLLAELLTHRSFSVSGKAASKSGVGLGTVTAAMLEPISRLIGLLEEPEAIELLAPAIQREIHYRLLQTDQAAQLRHIVSVDSQGHRIGRAIEWLKINFNRPLRVEELADQVQMSAASFHHHFRQLTAMSPLQYQKWLRLNEAKRLMLSEHQDAATASYSVGYESPSQFSREYRRLFGAPPRQDIEALRREVSPAG